MPVYFLETTPTLDGAAELARRLHDEIPSIQKITSLEQLERQPAGRRRSLEAAYLLYPFKNNGTSLDQLTELASKWRERVFFIFISEDISAKDYKLLVRTGNADWVSTRAEPQEIREVFSRHHLGVVSEEQARRTGVFSFLPSAGGVGNSTIAIDSALQLRGTAKTGGPRVCLVDLDFQSSHVCDLLDIEARLQVGEIAANPERLDAQLFDVFVSHHSSGLDVLAAPRVKQVGGISIAALDALFAMVSRSYDAILVDLPVCWVEWTPQILGASDVVVVTGVNTIPGLRQVAETIKAVREIEQPQREIQVLINRCETTWLGSIADQQYGKRMLAGEKITYVREDSVTARQSANTGIPPFIGSPSSKLSKDIRSLAAALAAVRSLGPPSR